MNAFRILFLFVVLAGALVLAMAQMVPGVVEEQSRGALAERARLESLLIAEMERNARGERAIAAERVAASSAVRAALSAPEPREAASAFRQAARVVTTDTSLSLDGLALVDRDGRFVDGVSSIATIDPSDFATKARADRVAQNGEPVDTYFSVLGRLFAAHAVPVAGQSGGIVGAVVAVQEYDSAAVASMRSGTGAYSAFFVGFEVVASNVADEAVAAEVQSIVRRTTASSVGSPGRLLMQEFRQVEDRTAMLAPVSLASGDERLDRSAEIGFVVVVEANAVPTNLPALLARLRAFDEGTGALWISLGCALLVFFGGLAFLDAMLARAVRDLAKRIRDNATENDPAAVPVRRYGTWLRPAAEAYNAFLDAYRAQTPMARRARNDSSAALFRVDASSPGRPVLLHQDEAGAEASDEPLGPAGSHATSSAVFDDIEVPQRTEESPGMFRIDTGRHVGVDAPDDTAAPEQEPVADPFADFAPAAVAAAPPADPPQPPAPDLGATDEAPAFAPVADFELDTDPEGASAEGDFEALFAEAEAVVEAVERRSSASGSNRLVHGEPRDVTASEVASDTLDEFDAEWSALMSDVEEKISGNVAAVEQSEVTPAGVPNVDSAAQAEAAPGPQGEAPPAGPDKPTHSTVMMPGLAAFGSGEYERITEDFRDVGAEHGAPSDDDVPPSEHEPPHVTEPTLPFSLEQAPEPDTADEPEAGPSHEAASPEQVPEPEDAAAPGAAPGALPASARTMVGMNFGAAGPSSTFQRLRAASTPQGVDAVREPSLFGESERRSTAPGGAPPLPPEASAEAPGDIGAREAEDLQASDTVPRVSVESLARRASGARPTGEHDALLAAAEDRLRRLRPGAQPEMHRALYEEFRAAKAASGEDVSRLTYPRFVDKLDRNKAALVSRYNCRDVRFEVSVRNGKVTLKATPLR